MHAFAACNTITFESLDVGSSYLHMRLSPRTTDSYMKVIGSRSRSQDEEQSKSLFPQCKTLIGNNSGSIKHRAVKFACSMGFSTIVERMVWPPSLSRDRRWPRVTKWMHLVACNTITFESLHVVSLFSHYVVYLQGIGLYRSGSYMKVIGSNQGHKSQKGRNFLFPQCKTSIGNNSGSTKHRAMKFACSMGVLTTGYRMVWPPSLSRDRKWPHVTKCTHSRVVGLRVEGNLVNHMIKKSASVVGPIS